MKQNNIQDPDAIEMIVRITTIGLLTIVLPATLIAKGCENSKSTIEQKVRDAPAPQKVSSSYDMPESQRLSISHYMGLDNNYNLT